MFKNTRETKDMPLLAPVVAQDEKKLHLSIPKLL